jgi:hypothetical protein
VATITQSAEQTTMATVATIAVAASVAATRNSVAAVGAAIAAMAAQPAKQTAVAAVATAGGARTRAARGTAMRAGAPVATTQINRFGTAAQGHHEDNTVHFRNLQQQREPTQAELW